MTSFVTKEIMKRSRLRSKFLNSKGETDRHDRKAYNKQRNYCVSLMRTAKQTFPENINTTDVTDIKILEYLHICNIFYLINGPRVTFGSFD